MINLTTNNIDFSQLANTLNIVLIVLFVVIIVTLVLEIIRGFMKGIFKTTFQFVMMLMMIIIAFSTLNILVDTVGAIDAVPFVGPYMILTSSDGLSSVTVQVGTIMETLRGGIEGALKLYGFSGTASDIANIAIPLARSLVMTVVLIVDIILILILGNLFISLLWHLFFKRVVPKIQRKSVKIRWLSALEQGVKYVCVTLLFMMPFTSIVNTVNNSYQKLDDNLKQNEIVAQVGQFLDTYNDSLFAKSLFHWSYNEDTGMTWDTSIFSYLTQSGIDYGDGNIEQFSASYLLGTLSDISFVVLGVAGGASNATGIINNITGQTLVTIFDSLNRYQLFSYLLPIGISIGIGFLDNNPLPEDAFDGVDFKNDTLAVESFIVDLVNAGILDGLFKDNGDGTTNFDPTLIIDNILTSKAYNYVKRAIKRIDDCEILKRAMPAVMSFFATSTGDGPLGSLLPTPEEASSIAWGQELSVLYDSLYQISKGDPELIDLIKTSMTAGQTPAPEVKAAPEEGQGNDLGTQIFENILKHVDLFKHILLGDFDEQGNLINVDKHGYAKTGAFTSKHIPLFDLTLLNRIIGPTFNMLKDSLSKNPAFGDVSSMMDIVTGELFDENYLKNVKEELGLIFDILSAFQENQVLDLFKRFSDETKKETPDFQGVIDDITRKDPYKIEKISSNISLIDRSKILPTIFKELLKNTFDNQSEEGGGLSMLNDLGIEITSSTIENIQNIGLEASKLIRALPHILKLQDIMPKENESMNFTKIEANYEHIAAVLDTVYNSEILNPKGKNQFDNNFVGLLENILGQMSETVAGISFKKEVIASLMKTEKQNWQNSVNANGDYPRDRNGNAILDGEIGDIINVLRCFAITNSKGQTLIEAFSGGNITQAIGSLNKEFKIEQLFAAIEKSAVFKATFGDLLDATLGDPAIGLIEEGRSFNEVSNWAEEGKKFGDLCDKIGEAGIEDLTQLDFMSFDNYQSLNKLCHSLADSTIFIDIDAEDPYSHTTFNRFIYEKVKDSMSDLLKDDNIKNPDAPATFNKAAKDFDIQEIVDGEVKRIHAQKDDWCSDEWIKKYMDAPLIPESELPADYYEMDTISKVILVLKNVRDINEALGTGDEQIGDNISSLNVKPEVLKRLFDSMNNVQPFRMVLYNSLCQVFANVSIPLFDFNTANYEWIADDNTTIEDKEAEIERIVSVYDSYYSHFKDLQNDPDIMTKILKTPENIIYLRDMLYAISSSEIFHASGIRETKVPKENTFFQELIEAMLTNAQFDQFFYRNSNPHSLDANVKAYNSYETKVSHYVRNVVFKVGTPKLEENIDDVLEILSSVTGGPKNVHGYVLAEGAKVPDTDLYDGILDENGQFFIDVATFDAGKIEPIILNMNKSLMFNTAVPNIIDMILDQGNAVPQEGDILTAITSRADPYYCYWPKGYNAKFDPKNGTNRYTDERDDKDDNDISTLMRTIDSFKNLNDFLLNNDLTKIMDPSFKNYAEFETMFKDTLYNLNSSNIFHRYGVKNRDNSSAATAKLDLSSFETIFEKLYHDTTLDTLIYNAEDANDTSKYPALPTLNITKEQNKVMTLIAQKSIDDLAGGVIGDKWHQEIDSLFSFLADARKLELGDFASGVVDIFSPSTKFTPVNLRNVLMSLNSMDTTQGAVGHLLHQALSETILKDYATYDGVDYSKYFLTQEEFAKPNGIGSFITFLDDLANYKMVDGKYVDINGNVLDENDPDLLDKKVFNGYVLPTATADQPNPIVNFVGTIDKPNKSVSCILKFIDNSALYSNNLTIKNGSQSEVIGAKSLVLYNMLNPEGSMAIADYFFGANDFEKMLTVNQLLSLKDYSPEADGNAIDTLVRSELVSEGFNPGDISQISGGLQKTLGRIFYSLTHEDGNLANPVRTRAYIVSEVLAGIVDELIQSEIAFNNNTFKLPSKLYIPDSYILVRQTDAGEKLSSYKDICSKTYDLLNDHEGQALEGILNLFSVVSSVDLSPENIATSLVTILDAVNSNFKYLSYKESDASNVYLNSKIASLIYQSRVNGLIDAFVLTPNINEANRLFDLYSAKVADPFHNAAWLNANKMILAYGQIYPTMSKNPTVLFALENVDAYKIDTSLKLFSNKVIFDKPGEDSLHAFLNKTMDPSTIAFNAAYKTAMTDPGAHDVIA